MKNEKGSKPGSYADAVKFMGSVKVFTKNMVLAFLKKQGKTINGALATAGVTMGARKEDSKRSEFGGCLGNLANTYHGIRGYLVPLKSKSANGEKQYRFHKCDKAEIDARQKIADKRELPSCRAKVAAKADKARAAKVAAKAKKEAKSAIKATAKMVKSKKAAPKAAPKAKKVKAPKAVEQTKVTPPVPVTGAPAETTLAPTVS